MKKDLLDYLANYLLTGAVIFVIVVILSVIFIDFITFINSILLIALFIAGIIFLGFCVSEGSSYIYKIVKNRYERKI